MSEESVSPLSRAAREAGEYPLLKREGATPPHRPLIRCDVGEPLDEPPRFVESALRDAVPATRGYPVTQGSPALREAAAGWFRRRFGVELDPEREIVPSLGSKEAIFHLALVLADAWTRPRVLCPEPGYPVYRLGAGFAGCTPTPLPMRPDRGYVPDLDAVPDGIWRETSILWLNHPHNPSGAGAPLALYARASELADRYGFWVASDEAYADLFRPTVEPPPSALQVTKRRVIVFHTLSKRSSMAGYRAGFMAGDPGAMAHLARCRPAFGVGMPQFVQAAAVEAWGEDEHAAAMRRRYVRRWEILREALLRLGFEVFESVTPFFVWARVPEGAGDREWAAWLESEAGVRAVPGSSLGAAGYLRFAATPEETLCLEAARRLSELQGRRPA